MLKQYVIEDNTFVVEETIDVSLLIVSSSQQITLDLLVRHMIRYIFYAYWDKMKHNMPIFQNRTAQRKHETLEKKLYKHSVPLST